MKRIKGGETNIRFPKVNFIGNKKNIAGWICDHFPQDAKSVLDLFSGGGSVSFFAKKKGLKVISNDVMAINYLLAKALIENKEEKLDEKDADIIFSGKPTRGFMYENYSGRYFLPRECMELDRYRRNIEKLSSSYKRNIALVLLRRAMIRKMPYSRFDIPWNKIQQLRDEEYSYGKYGRRRAYHNKSFRFHFEENISDYNNAIFDNGQRNLAFNKDAFDLLGKVKADLVYLDPPYTGTMNNYFRFYGVLDEYIHSKKLAPFKNNFIDKERSLVLFDTLFSRLASYRYWMLSYNNNSYPSKSELLALMKRYGGNVKVIEKPHNYQITGKERKQENKEFLFIATNK